jgi:hypothetical protein
MKKLLAIIFLIYSVSSADASEWVPYVYHAPSIIQAPPVQYIPYTYYVPSTVMVPVVPVVSYQNVVVEHRCWHLFKKYEVVRVPQTFYVPVAPTRY